jgi:fluoroacetyl-CoA thioesterase
MKDSLKPGISYELRYRVPESKTVPYLYAEAPEFQQMPRVFATGFMVGFVEWACLMAIIPHIDWPTEGTVGTQVNLSHLAATPPGLEVHAKVTLVQVEGRRLVFEVEADDGVDTICKGTHERFIINAPKIMEKVKAKAAGKSGREKLTPDY